MTSQDGDTLARTDQIRVKMDEVMPLTNNYLIDSIVIQNPSFHYVQYDSIHSNLSALFKVAPDSGSAVKKDSVNNSVPAQQQEIRYHINSFQLLGGSFNFTDHSLETDFSYSLSEVKATADSISSEN